MEKEDEELKEKKLRAQRKIEAEVEQRRQEKLKAEDDARAIVAKAEIKRLLEMTTREAVAKDATPDTNGWSCTIL